MKRPRFLAVGLLLGATLLTLPSAVAAGDANVLVPYGASGWRYQVVGHGEQAGFEDPIVDVSSWPTGQAAFGSGGGCSLDSTIHTNWPSTTDILLRRDINLEVPANVEIGVAVDNDVTVFWDGFAVGSQVHDFCPEHDQLIVKLANVGPGTHVLALRGVDRHGASFIDVRVRAVAPECTIVGTNGNDILIGTPGPDVICGRAGNDRLVGMGGNDILRGNRGTDHASFAMLPNGVDVDLATGTAYGQGVDLLFGIEGVRGSDAGDRIAGNAGPNDITGLGGADMIIGRGGPDLLTGDNGNDYLIGGKGDDTLVGGPGANTCNGGPGVNVLVSCL